MICYLMGKYVAEKYVVGKMSRNILSQIVPEASAIFSGAILAFAFAMLEVSDSMVLAQKKIDYPIAKAIYELSNILGEGRYLASALGVWAMLFLGLTIAAASQSIGARLGTLFRG
jgi:iron(III) transport system permease protein